MSDEFDLEKAVKTFVSLNQLGELLFGNKIQEEAKEEDLKISEESIEEMFVDSLTDEEKDKILDE